MNLRICPQIMNTNHNLQKVYQFSTLVAANPLSGKTFNLNILSSKSSTLITANKSSKTWLSDHFLWKRCANMKYVTCLNHLHKNIKIPLILSSIKVLSMQFCLKMSMKRSPKLSRSSLRMWNSQLIKKHIRRIWLSVCCNHLFSELFWSTFTPEKDMKSRFNRLRLKIPKCSLF